MMLLPPKEGVCPVCAVDHKPHEAHNAQSLYYKMRFKANHGRWPTWADATAHCSELARRAWKGALTELKGWTEPPAGCEVIAEPVAESIRQCVGDPTEGIEVAPIDPGK